MAMGNYKLELKQRGVGDTIMATKLVRGIKKSHPQINLNVVGTLADDVFLNNPYVSKDDDSYESVTIDVKGPLDDMWLTGRGCYQDALIVAWTRETGIPVRSDGGGVDLYLSDSEKKSWCNKPYWVVAAGSKSDMPVKQWPVEHFQHVINNTPEIRWVQVGAIGDGRPRHIQQQLSNVEYLVGKTTLRELFSVIYNAEGVLCHLSAPFWIADAFCKPRVAIGGGREPGWLYESNNHSMVRGVGVQDCVSVLTTVGLYDCCRVTGCGARGVVPVHNETPYPENYLCKLPVLTDTSAHAKCMVDTQPELVVRQVKRINGIITPR